MSVKMTRVEKVAIGASSGAADVAENIIRFSDRLVSPDGVLVEPIPIINDVQAATGESRAKHWEIELELDGDNYEMFRNQDANGTGGSRLLSDTARNAAAGYFLVSGKDTGDNDVSYSYEANKTWLAYHRGHVSNAPNTERNPTLYRWVCTGNRTLGSSSVAGSDSNGEKYIRVNSVTVNSVEATNILSYDWELVGASGKDILEPRHGPGSYQAVGVVEPSGKHWAFRLVFDSYTNLFNTWIVQDGENTVIPYDVIVELEVSDGTQRYHTYESGKCYVTGYVPSSITERNIYNPGVIEFLCIGDRVDST